MPPVALFPDSVALVIATEAMWNTPLCHEEEALIENAVQKRRREFRAGRHAAHEALRQLGTPHQPILRGARREPIWPAGFVGTISHCKGLGVAACAQEPLAGLGIDVEPLEPLPEGVARYIYTDEELACRTIQELPPRLLFCAKESLYKCYHPLLGEFFGFQSVRLNFDTEKNSFDFRPTEQCEIAFPRELTFHGRYQIGPSHLYAACHLLRR